MTNFSSQASGSHAGRRRLGVGAPTVLFVGLVGLVLTGLVAVAAKLKPKTTLVSVNAAGTGSGDDSSNHASISANGRFVVFHSDASDLVANAVNGSTDVYVHDLKTGNTALISVNAAGTGGGNDISEMPSISATGRFVAFESDASNLVANDANGTTDVFVRDRNAGEVTLVSVNAAGTGSGNADSYLSSISADGRFVAFESYASDLAANDTNGEADVFVRDRKTGTTVLASVNAAGTGGGNKFSIEPSISANGRFVVFTSPASDLVANDANGKNDVFVRDLKTGTTALVSVNAAGTSVGNSGSEEPSISANGRFVAFSGSASDLVANDANGKNDVFVRDLKTGKTTLVSVNAAGTGGGNDLSHHPSISGNGRFVAFRSVASDLVTNDANGQPDIFVRDLKTGKTTLVSVNAAGTGSGNGVSFYSSISSNGRLVAFDSDASDLVATDANKQRDIFVRKLP